MHYNQMTQLKKYRYLLAHVCFLCRKSFKRPYSENEEKRCPECGGNCIALSRNFKAPKKDDKAQWEKVEFLVNEGFRFFSHPVLADGSPVPLKTLVQAKEFIKNDLKELEKSAPPMTARALKRQKATQSAKKHRKDRIKKAEHRRALA